MVRLLFAFKKKKKKKPVICAEHSKFCSRCCYSTKGIHSANRTKEKTEFSYEYYQRKKKYIKEYMYKVST